MTSHFVFVDNKILRDNLDIAFNHILVLTPFSESESYDDLAKSSFRKTIIIYTASIIEALLLHLLQQKCTEEDLTLYKWDLIKYHVLYEVSTQHKIVAGDFKKSPEKIKFEKLNLGNVSKYLCDKGFITKSLFDRVDKVRVLRNEQHIGTHKEIKDYTKNDLEYVFSVAKDVKKLLS